MKSVYHKICEGFETLTALAILLAVEIIALFLFFIPLLSQREQEEKDDEDSVY